jgi:hypothetical protein
VVRSLLLVALAAFALVVSPPPVNGAELLTNGGFEAGTDGWVTTFGALEDAGAPVRSGARSAMLTSDALQSHEVYQFAAVAPGEAYSFGGWVSMADPNVERVFLRVSWFNGSGGLISAEDSAWLTIPADEFRSLNIGPVNSPAAAASARVGVRVQAGGAFTLHLDDFSFAGVLPPAPTEPPSPTTAPPTVSPTPAPATRTPRPSAAATPTPVQEPDAFSELTNGGFEELRGDGTPYAWKEVGAELSTVGAPHMEGARALRLTSRSGSTKWAYQTVTLTTGGWYDAGVWARTDSGEAFLRVSWYASDDGSGAAIDSVDSSEVVTPAFESWIRLSTGPVTPPEGARSAKVRLMLRPDSTASMSAYFDATEFGQVGAPPPPTSGDATGAGALTTSRRGTNRVAAPVEGLAPRSPDDEAVAVPATPFVFANTRPEKAPSASAVPRGGSGSGYPWLAYVGIATGLAAVGYAGLTELARRRSDDRR